MHVSNACHLCVAVSFSNVSGINGTIYIKFEHISYICLVAKNLLMNITKMNKHSNVTTFVRALLVMSLQYYTVY